MIFDLRDEIDYRQAVVGCLCVIMLTVFLGTIFSLSVVFRMEKKLKNIEKALAPLGEAVLEKGLEVVEKMDGQGLSKDATEGVREVGSEAKKRIVDMIKNAKVKKEEVRP